jgi:hypothetical protein
MEICSSFRPKLTRMLKKYCEAMMCTSAFGTDDLITKLDTTSVDSRLQQIVASCVAINLEALLRCVTAASLRSLTALAL